MFVLFVILNCIFLTKKTKQVTILTLLISRHAVYVYTCMQI